MLVSGKLLAKKGAIFGMDARIALVIFSVLGLTSAFFAKDVISGKQEETFISQIKTIRDAVKQNIADNGYDFTVDGTKTLSNILGVKNSSEYTGTNYYAEGRNNQAYVSMQNIDSKLKLPWNIVTVDMNNLYASTNKDPANNAGVSTTDCVNTSRDCFYFVKFSNVDEQTFKLIEAEYDGDTTGFADATAKTTGHIVVNSTTNDLYMRVGRRL
jgi:hypothetical protein